LGAYFGSCLRFVITRDRHASSKNVAYVYHDHDLKTTRGARFQANCVNERFGVVDIAPSKTPKTLSYGDVKDFILLIHLTKLNFSRIYWSEGRQHTQRGERRMVPVSDRSQWRRCRLGYQCRGFDSHLDWVGPLERSPSEKETKT